MYCVCGHAPVRVELKGQICGARSLPESDLGHGGKTRVPRLHKHHPAGSVQIEFF